MRKFLALCSVFVFAPAAMAAMHVTEWMYSGIDGEFIEFTNTGGLAIDMTGWSFDDDSRLPGVISLSAFGIVQPGESVILSELPAAEFSANWALGPAVDVIGGNAANLSRNDEINLFDQNGLLVDRLTFGDQNIPGTIRTQEFSGNPGTTAALGVNNVSMWVLSSVGDSFGSYEGVLGSVGNPGTFVPEPSTLALLLLGLPAIARRR